MNGVFVIGKNVFTYNAMSIPGHLPPRDSVRPIEFRQPSFFADFDSETLFYEAVRLGSRVKIIAPPFNNLKDVVSASTFRRKSGSQPVSKTIIELERQTQIDLSDAGDEEIVWHLGGQDLAINPTTPEMRLFAGKRVVFTLTKDNPIHWIQDWARFYRDAHGADAVLVFDNASTEYTCGDLLESIASLRGIAAAAVVEWPFKYGPRGASASKYWDSDFCQLAALETARWRFLQDARSALNCDIDELIVSKKGRSIFEHVEKSLTGMTIFLGDWIVGLEGQKRAERLQAKFTDYDHALRRKGGHHFGFLPIHGNRCRSKWAVVPSRCPASAQWHIHTIKGSLKGRLISHDFSLRHFREMNTSWKYDRTDRTKFDPKLHIRDDGLLRAYARVDWRA